MEDVKMIDFDRLAKEEKVADIISFLVKNDTGFSYPQMDMFFTRHNFSVIESGEFMRVFKELRESGVVAWEDKM